MGQPLKILFQDDFNKNLRRTVMRYVNLSTILVYRLVSEKVMARFPDYDTLIKGVVCYFSYRNSNQSSWWIMQELNYPLLFFQHEFLISPRLLTNINFSFRQKQWDDCKILVMGILLGSWGFLNRVLEELHCHLIFFHQVPCLLERALDSDVPCGPLMMVHTVY